MLNSRRILNYRYAELLLKKINCTCGRRKFQSLELNDIPKVTPTDIRKLLRLKGFSVQDGFTSLTTKCTICARLDTCAESKVYINKATGYFLCPKCNVHGSWSVLEKQVKKAKADLATREHIDKCVQEYDEFQKEWQELVSKTSSLSTLTESELEDLSSLFEFTMSLTNCNASKVLSEVRISEDRTILYFPLKNSMDFVVGYRKVQAGKDEEVDLHGLASAGLFWCRPTKVTRGDQAVIVTSINDILHLCAEKVPGTHIWLNNSSLPPTLLPSLEGYQKLCLWGDWENMRDIANKLGEDRCRFVRPTDGLVTASEAAAARLSLRALVAEAKPAAHRSITTFAALRDDVYAELSNIDKVRGVKWRRFPALTRLLGGHRRGELSVLTGPTGCGKTTLCAEMSLDLAQQGVTTQCWQYAQKVVSTEKLKWAINSFEPFKAAGPDGIFPALLQWGGTRLLLLLKTILRACLAHRYVPKGWREVTTLWGSFEIRNSRLARTMLQQFAGVPLEQNLHSFAAYADDFQKLPIYYLAFHGQQPVKVVMEAVEHARYMHDISHVVVDNVQFMLGLGEERDGDRYSRQDAVIAAFRTFATARHCHVTLVMHPRKERDSEDLSTSSIFGSAKASQEADNVLIIQDKRLTAVRGKKYLQVAKNRYSGDLGIVPLEFDKDALSYQAKKKTKSDKAKSDEPEALLQQCFEGFAVDARSGAGAACPERPSANKPAESYLSNILNLNRTR